jgi:hypothetical protein
LFTAVLSASAMPSGTVRGADYAWPLLRFSGCTSLFGDYRPGRYHAGLDLRTDGQVGWPVVAVADGYVLRASTSYYGYGKVLYLALDDGRVAVYGHLNEFGPQVTERILAEQKRTQRYYTNLYFKENELRVSRGMTIARTGETGAGAPHLHFEIRTADNRPLNPGWQGFAVADRRDPEIATLWLVPQYEGGKMGVGPGGLDPVKVPLTGSAHAPMQPVHGTIFAAGPVGWAVEAYDRKPNSQSRHNVSGLSLVVGGDTLFSARFDSLDFETMDQIRLERLTWLDSDGDVYALYKSRGNELAHSRVSVKHPHGILLVGPGDTALPFEIVVTDENRNRRTVRGRISYREPELLFADAPTDPVVIRARSLDLRADRARGLAADLEARGLSPRLHSASVLANRSQRLFAMDVTDSIVWHEATEPLLSQTTVLVLRPGLEHHVWLHDSSLEIRVPAGAVYEPSFLTLRREDRPGLPPVVHVGPEDLVLRSAVRLSFRAPADTRQALFSVNGSAERLSFVEGRRQDGRIECRAGGPAGFTFAIDSVPPVIRRLRPSEEAVVGRRAAIVAQLEDDLSGVGNDSLVSVRVDGQWLPPEYDPETNQLVARPFEPFSPGSHRLEVEVHDWAGNVARVQRTFHVK